jgi:hypothetical protein
LHQEILFNIHSGLFLFTISAIGAYLSYSLRQLPAIFENKSHIIYLPFYIAFLSLIMAPVRMLGFARLADNLGWGTRSVSISKLQDNKFLKGLAYD